jgi:hypothetical protein
VNPPEAISPWRSGLWRRLPLHRQVCPVLPDPEQDRLAVSRLTAWLDRGFHYLPGCPCLGWVAGGRCQGHRGRPYRDRAVHCHRWRCPAGHRIVTAQPRGFDTTMEAHLLLDTAAWGLIYEIEPDAAWWHPDGRTLLVIATP